MSKSGKLASRLVRCGQCAPCQSLEGEPLLTRCCPLLCLLCLLRLLRLLRMSICPVHLP